MDERENYLRAVRFESPETIPMHFAVNAASWRHYGPGTLSGLMEAHPLLFPDFRRLPDDFVPEFAKVARKDEPYTDDFGCVWTTTVDGITGTVTGHPLADWSAFEGYRFPDPAVCSGIGPIDWEERRRETEADRAAGRLAWGGLRHGHTFLQLCDLRGYRNLMYDFADEAPELMRLISGLEEFNAGIVARSLALGVDAMGYGEDLGMQNAPMLSPAHFRKYILPSYRRLMRPARELGALIHMHSDGHLHALVDDLLDGGVDIINLQDLVNGVDWIAERFAGRTCVELDIDRQSVTVFGTPADVERLVREEVRAIGSPQGGLLMVYGLYPGTPLANVEALMDAMEKYATYFR